MACCRYDGVQGPEECSDDAVKRRDMECHRTRKPGLRVFEDGGNVARAEDDLHARRGVISRRKVSIDGSKA